MSFASGGNRMTRPPKQEEMSGGLAEHGSGLACFRDWLYGEPIARVSS